MTNTQVNLGDTDVQQRADRGPGDTESQAPDKLLASMFENLNNTGQRPKNMCNLLKLSPPKLNNLTNIKEIE